MAVRRNFLVDLLVGKEFIPSRNEYKYSLLRAQFSIIILLVSTFYIILDSVNSVNLFIPWYAFMLAVSIGIIVINRAKFYGAATTLLLALINILIFMFCDVDNPQGGVFFYFITCSITGFILAGYYNMPLGFAFALLPVALGYIAYSYDFQLMPEPSYEPRMIKINFLANFIIAILSNLFVIYFLISRNRESEENLRENQEHSDQIAQEISQKNTQLAKTNEELDRFVYSASHDMRAPLTSLMGLINLSEKTSNLLEMRGYLEMMKGRIKTMEGFIKEITDYSRNSRLGLTLENIRLADLIEEITRNLSFIDADQKIRIEIDSSCQLTLRTDPNRLRIVVNNLVANAYRYHWLSQDDPFIVFRAEKKDSSIILHVQDNGRGIEPDHHQKIFDMFYRASEISDGSGLGLYIVRETLEKLGGRISVISQLGKGSTFTVTLPA